MAAGLATLVMTGVGLADLVYFAKGGQAQLPSKVEGDLVQLETPDGPKSFPRSDFLAIVPEPSPLTEWPARCGSALKVGTAEARFAAAWWALENGLTSEALAAFEELRPLTQGHPPTRRALASLDAMTLPCPDPDLDPIRARLRPLKFRETRSPHVLLLHQASDADAKERLDTLERVVQTFLVAFAAQGIELPAPSRRLVSVYFAERRDYIHFLRTVDAAPFVDTQGYYHPGLHAVFAFDTRSGDEQKTRHRAIANRKRDGAAPSDLARQALLLDLEWRTNDLGIAAHETVHLLTAETGLAPHFDDFPHWLHEGLAAQFEVVRGGRWAGIGRAHDLRLPDWRSIHPLPRLVPLVKDVGFAHGYRRDLYAEAWAFVYYLRKTHPREFLAFLDFLRSPASTSAANPRPDRTFEAFRAAFGNDLAGLEADWRRYMAELKTPLEAGKPSLPDRAVDAPASDSKRRLVGEVVGH
jgi:Protein of unknown function (DUF1570)